MPPLPLESYSSAQSENRTAVVQEWLSRLPRQFHTTATQDMDAALEANLDQKSLAKVQWLLTSEQMLRWLKSRKSRLLVVQGDPAPMEVLNYLNFASAFVARSFRDTPAYPTLYYSCGLRNQHSIDESESGPIALLNTLNAQLVQWIGEYAESTDLAFLEEKKYKEKALKDRTYATQLLRRLVQLLGPDSAIFIVVDGVSRLSGPGREGRDTLKPVLEILKSEEIVSKVLLTDLISMLWLDEIKHLEITVPVDVGRFWDVSSLDESAARPFIKAREESSRLSDA
jgi:hypothetical protein